jgi:biotin-dependent carboxylase-like uncharacterized protein
MIEIIHPGTMTFIVDSGRYGYACAGVPPSSALDDFAYCALNRLLGQEGNASALEVIGAHFSIRFHRKMVFAVTGAEVKGTLDDKPVNSWASFMAEAGSVLKIHEVTEGFRYYLGFSGDMKLERVIGSFSFNLECRFGGYQGRPLTPRDRIDIDDIYDVSLGAIPTASIPGIIPPHLLRVTVGPEQFHFLEDSLEAFFNVKNQAAYEVSTAISRTGIRLKGRQLHFREGVEKSIISEGILPGTVQISGDGMPIIMLYERTIGGYARIARVVRADLHRLAHLKPGDSVLFQFIEIDEAEHLWVERQNAIAALTNIIRRRT